MKRSRRINLERMRKAPHQHPHTDVTPPTGPFALRPLALGVAAAAGLLGCSENRVGYIYESIDDCAREQVGRSAECRAAYENALQKHRQEGQKFPDEAQCENEFGEDRCERRGNYFMPFMAGYLFAPYLNRAYYPMYSSYSPSSRYYGKWSTVDGETYPKTASKQVTVTQRTMSRGGFGSTTAARSKWGGKSSRGSWGG